MPVLVLALTWWLLGAGCGGDDPETFSPVVTEPPTKVEFLREADEICFAAEAQIEAAGDDIFDGRGEIDAAEVRRVSLAVVVPALRAEVAAIGALEPPEGDEAEIQAILDATEEGIAQIQADPAALLDGPPAALRRAQRLAEAYGSRECGFRG